MCCFELLFFFISEIWGVENLMTHISGLVGYLGDFFQCGTIHLMLDVFGNFPDYILRNFSNVGQVDHFYLIFWFDYLRTFRDQMFFQLTYGNWKIQCPQLIRCALLPRKRNSFLCEFWSLISDLRAEKIGKFVDALHELKTCCACRWDSLFTHFFCRLKIKLFELSF